MAILGVNNDIITTQSHQDGAIGGNGNGQESERIHSRRGKLKLYICRRHFAKFRNVSLYDQIILLRLGMLHLEVAMITSDLL